MLNLDTHVLLYALTDDLTPRERAYSPMKPGAFRRSFFGKSPNLSELRRIELDLDYPELARTLTRIQTWPLTLDICRSIKSLDFDSDPCR